MDALRARINAFPREIRPVLHAWAQMGNHQHILLAARSDPSVLAAVMRSVSTSYAKHHNEKYGTCGPVFQSPFRGEVIRDAEHLVNTIAYIHLNPDATVREANSSHGFYAGLRDDPDIDPSLAWRAFGGREGYLEFFSDTAKIRAARAAARRRLG